MPKCAKLEDEMNKKNVLYEYVFSNFFVNNTVSLSLLVELAAVFTVYFTIYIPIEGRQHSHKV